jgi:hypothetical protein
MLLKINFDSNHNFIEVEDLGNWRESHQKSENIALNWTKGNENNTADSNHISLNPNKLVIARGSSGEHPLFYTITHKTAIISDSVARIAELINAKASITACYEFIYLEYPGPSRTLFEGISQVLNGQAIEISFGNNCEIEQQSHDSFSVPTTEYEGTISETALANSLRSKIVESHTTRTGRSNTVLLSGGIDSQVMAITLRRDLGLQNVLAATFSVEGSEQDESNDAAQVANQLGLEWLHLKIDPNRDIDIDAIAHLNSPYIGAIAMQQFLPKIQAGRSSGETLFAGQDTRLHTPALGAYDKWIWSTLYETRILSKASAKFATLSLATFPNREKNNFFNRLLLLFAESPDFTSFLANRYFHIRRFPFNRGSTEFSEAVGEIHKEMGELNPQEPRKSYNRVVECNWRRQYLFDIGHMVGSAQKHGLNCTLPFYDHDLSSFSARIPFSVATKLTAGRAGHNERKIKVNKYLLREAYKSDLDHSLIYRDKAVCATNHLFLNGCMRGIIVEFINDTQVVNSTAGHILHMPEIREICKQKDGRWEARDNWIANVVFNTLIVWRLIMKHDIATRH